MEYYRSYNASWNSLGRFFSNYTEFDSVDLRACGTRFSNPVLGRKPDKDVEYQKLSNRQKKLLSWREAKGAGKNKTKGEDEAEEKGAGKGAGKSKTKGEDETEETSLKRRRCTVA